MNIRQVFPENTLQWMKDNQEQFGILVMRAIISLMWLSQGLSKLILRNDDSYLDFNSFKGDLNYMRVTHPWGFISNLLENFAIPNYEIFAYIVLISEISLGILIGIGLFSRLSAFGGGVMTSMLWILTLGWDEWIWTYPLIFFPHVLLFFAKSGKQIGIDRMLNPEKTVHDAKR